MDVFERVREVNAGAALTAEQITAARSCLLGGIDESTVAARKHAARRPAFLIAGAVVGAAAVTATALVVTHVATPAPRVEAIPAPSASPAPSGAATPAPYPSASTGAGTSPQEPFPGTTPQEGQYLRLTTKTEVLVYRGPEGTAYEWGYRYPTVGMPFSALLVRTDGTLYVPADRASEWVQVSGPPSQRVRPFPEPQSPEDAAAWDALLPAGSGDSIARAAGGRFSERSTPTDFSVYPGDPSALLDYLRAQFAESGPDVDEQMMMAMVGVLRGNLAPAPLRKTFIEALELSGKSTVVSTEGPITTYAVDYVTTGVRRETITIDARTGWATEYTLSVHRDDGGLVPESVPDLRFTLSQEIVDSAP
ncbi:hypothetical protein LXM50_00555 [Microbacterium sp. Au-Mic1]|uniref:hypothetical protein n=1 Tax=Microbacterium sp. Au-Mic1 TaxID=2906457 RepID=UPI001E53083A|nr:hypothetical protein [Microbacterium sp. Au-Mic1]MCE4024455.1 hypothetical protein [Microbacterium sp. Au-Mic1]